MSNKPFDLIVIGAGSGGIAAAQKAAASGVKVALVEMNKVGGTCVNLGCVPKKVMWYAGQLADSLAGAQDYGFKINRPALNFMKLVKARTQYIQTLQQSYESKLHKNHVTYLEGRAAFIDKNTIQIGNSKYTAKKFIIATGCHPNWPDFPGAEFGITSNGFFALTKVPKKIAIIGAGYIAIELACILNQLGSEVKILLRKSRILSRFDTDITNHLTKVMTEQGIEFLKNHSIAKITKQGKKLTLHCKNKKTLTGFDSVLFAIGRSPRIKQLNLAAAGVKTDKHDYVITNKEDKTNVANIYAIGDVAGKKMLTPVAIRAGRKLASRLFSKAKKTYMDYENIPTVIFSHPPLGTVGLSTAAAEKKYGKHSLTIHEAKFHSMYYALSKKKVTSAFKLITLKKNNKIVGLHLLDPNADEILQGFAAAIKMGATKEDFDDVIGIHPTSAEELVGMK
jgi:glutathione reductase (NADPH)